MKLSICMMIKDEEKNLERCLNSLKPIIEKVESELIIIDTGSTDNSPNIAKQYTDQLYFHKWNNNFSEMRNISIGYAKGDWIMIIDADEQLQSYHEILDFLTSEESNIYNTVSIILENVMDNTDYNNIIFVSYRLFKNDGNFKYLGSVHNSPVFKRPVKKLQDVFIHYGYDTTDKELVEKKFKRTSELLLKELDKDPNNIYYRYQLSVSYSMHSDSDKAVEECEKAYELIQKNQKDLKKYIYIYPQLVKSLLKINNNSRAEVIAKEGLEIEREHIDLYYFLGGAQIELNKYDEAIESLNQYLSLVKKCDKQSISNNTMIYYEKLEYIEEVHFHLARMYFFKKNYKEVLKVCGLLTKENLIRESISIIIESFFRLEKFQDMKNYYDKTKEDSNIKQAFEIEIKKMLAEIDLNKEYLISKIFAEENDLFAQFNKIKVKHYEKDKSYLNDIENIFNNNKLEDLPSYFSELVYLAIKDNNSISEIFLHLRNEDIISLIELLDSRYQDFYEIVILYVNSYRSDEFKEIKVKKNLYKYLLSFDKLNDNDFLAIFKKYVNEGIAYIKYIYNINLVEMELINEMEINENKFFAYMYLSQNSKETNNSKPIYYIRKALNVFPYVNKGIKLLIEDMEKDDSRGNNEFEKLKEETKQNINILIEAGQYNEAKGLIHDYEQIVNKDIEIFSIKAVISILEDDLELAKNLLIEGLQIDNENFDLIYNMAFVFEKLGQYNKAYNYYIKAEKKCNDINTKIELGNIIERIKSMYKDLIIEDKKKLAFFAKQGMDSFISDIITGLLEEYDIKKIIVTDYKQIDDGIQWADICWFEWCDELVVYGSKLDIAKEKKIICRLHSYEAFTNYPLNVNWKNIDKVIFVCNHIMDNVLSKVRIDRSKCEVIYNGINLSKFKFKERKKGFSIAYVGYVNFKKGPMLLLHTFKAIYDMDKRYKLFIAGEFQEERYVLYFKQMIEAMGLQNNVIFEGWQKDINRWLEDKNYIINTSVLEGNPLGIMEGMARGIKPIIHNFVGAKQQFDKYVWNSIDECKRMLNEEYNSFDYRKYIESKFSLEDQMNQIFTILNNLTGDNKVYNMHMEEYLTISNNEKENQVEDYYNNFLTYLIKDRERENPRHLYLKNRISKLVKKGQSVLDLGCGIGITTEHIKKLEAGTVIGVDISPKLIEYAQNTVKNVEFMVHDITNVRLNNKFDVITMCDCMEHIPMYRYDELFHTIKYHLKPEGVVYISIPDNDYMRFIQKNRPELMQIIDNSIDYELMNQLCKQNNLKINFYNAYGTHIGNEYNEYIISNYEDFSKPWNSLLK
jgi:2-polyprenyl-3-methyl-5-hydroxy-6-metoxy-1,4-benzoquinol methylase/glycosyltransferase involved in cell wall biosynthesis